MRSRALIFLVMLLSAALSLPAGAGPKDGNSDPEGAVIGATYGHGKAGPGSYATLIDIHELKMDRGKPAAKPNCSTDQPNVNGGYALTGWEIVRVIPVKLNPATVPSHLGDVELVMQDSWDVWSVGTPAPEVDVLPTSTVTKYTANVENDILFGRTGSSLATTYTWRWNDGQATIESDTVFNKSVAWAHIADEGDGCNQDGAAVYDVANIATHEFGHSYGLDHPAGGRYETMYAYGYSGETLKRTPGAGDMEGIAALYQPTSP